MRSRETPRTYSAAGHGLDALGKSMRAAEDVVSIPHAAGTSGTLWSDRSIETVMPRSLWLKQLQVREMPFVVQMNRESNAYR